jgi:hypothetical protein
VRLLQQTPAASVLSGRRASVLVVVVAATPEAQVVQVALMGLAVALV